MRIRLVFTSGSATDIKRIRAALERLEGGRDILGSPDFECDDFKAERAGRCLNLAHLQHGGGIADIGHDRQPAETGDNLAQKFESLASKIGRLDRQAGDVAARSRQTRDQAGADRVPRRREDDRDDRCRLLCRDDCRGSRRDNDIDLEPDELGRDLGEALAASLRPAILDRDGAALDPAEFAQPLHKSGGPLAPGRRRARAQEPDGRQLRRLLRARRERPRRRRAAEQRDELAPSHALPQNLWNG